MSLLNKTKFYKEVPCKACDGTGKRPPVTVEQSFWFQMDFNTSFAQQAQAAQGICFGCHGRGTQTILDRIE